VAFDNGAAFNNSPAGRVLAQATGRGISLDATQVVQVAAFLRVIAFALSRANTHAVMG
jgi:hypothetical protein